MIEQTEQLALKNDLHRISHGLMCSRIRNAEGNNSKLAVMSRNITYSDLFACYHIPEFLFVRMIFGKY